MQARAQPRNSSNPTRNASGELWGDLANHNGRRAIGATSPVANQRDCVVTVDGKASARWLTGYRPAGRQGELVGLTTSADALRPVVRTTGTTGTADGGRSLLNYILERHDTSLAEIVDVDIESECGDYRRETASYRRCVSSAIGVLFRHYGSAGIAQENELTRCMVSQYESYCRAYNDNQSRVDIECDDAVTMAAFLSLGWDYGVSYDPLHALSDYTFFDFHEESGFPCRDLAEEHLASLGIEVHYCDECDDPNEYYLAPSE